MRKINVKCSVTFDQENWLSAFLSGRLEDKGARRLGVLKIQVGKKTWMFEKVETRVAAEQEYRQNFSPVYLLRDADSMDYLWWYEGVYYWEEYNLTPMEFKALVDRKAGQKKSQAIRALNVQQLGATEKTRAPIASEIRQFVYNRDNGKCIQCGSPNELQFDHIIPISKGGNDSADNLQLLCGSCNRSKSAKIQ